MLGCPRAPSSLVLEFWSFLTLSSELVGTAAGSSLKLISRRREDHSLSAVWAVGGTAHPFGVWGGSYRADVHRISERILDIGGFLLLFQLQLRDQGPASCSAEHRRGISAVEILLSGKKENIK